MSTGYCPTCKQNVFLKRPPLSIPLVIFLGCCCQLGLIIYLLVWGTKDANLCSNCGTVCQPIQAPSITGQVEYQPQQTQVSNIKYCPMCGKQLNLEASFCNNCGTKID